jgi:mannose-6-phosphate isomerase-like protein (cupin superfamily)
MTVGHDTPSPGSLGHAAFRGPAWPFGIGNPDSSPLPGQSEGPSDVRLLPGLVVTTTIRRTEAREEGQDVAFNEDILDRTRRNHWFREVLATGPHAQVVVMSIPPGGEIGDEVHDGVDQVLVFVDGQGEAILDGVRSPVGPDRLVLVPAGTRHNFVNTGSTDLRLYTIYAPPEHAPGTIHRTKAEADAAEGAEH